MATRFMTKNQSAGIILTAMQQSSTSDILAPYFGPICNCDIVTWVIDQIRAQNQAVITKIRNMIAPDATTPPTPITQTSMLGYCTKFEDKGAPAGEVYTYQNTTGIGVATTVVNIYTPAGVVVNQYCNGSTLMEKRANGTGGSTDVAVQVNSPSCT